MSTEPLHPRTRDAIARAHALSPILRKNASRRDAERVLPYDALALLREYDLLNLRTPLALGGAEIVDASVKTSQAQLATEHAALHVAQKLFDVGGTSTALRRHNFDRHWRNARTISLHDPIAYRSKAIGAWTLRGDPPPLGFTY